DRTPRCHSTDAVMPSGFRLARSPPWLDASPPEHLDRGGLVVWFRFGWLFDIVRMMKGHVGDGSGSVRLQGAWYSVKAKSFMHVLTHHVRIVQERLLEMSGSWVGLF